MISINKYGQNVDLSNIVEVDGKKSYSLDGLVVNNKLIIEVPKGVKFQSSLVEEDLKIEFKDGDGNIFELILKNMANLLAQNDGTELVEIVQADNNKVLASITDITSALEAAAAGPAAGANGNSDSSNNPGFNIDPLAIGNTTYTNDSINTPRSFALFGAAETEINVAPVIDTIPPQNVDEDNTLLISFTSSDQNNDTLTYSVTATNGTAVINGNGQILFTPNENYNGQAQVTLSANDGLLSTSQIIDITVNPVNDAPTIETQVNNVLENEILEGQLTAEDVDTDLVNLVFSTTSTDIEGFVLNSDGSYSFDTNSYDYLAKDEILNFSIPITVTDDFNATASSFLNITLTGTNDAPTVIATPTAIDRVESDFGTLAGNINSYHILTEAEIFALMDVQDVDVTDSLNLSLVTDSSNFVVNGTDVTGSTNGVVQLTAADITGFGLDPAVVNVGDFFVYSLEFDGLAKDELASVTFEVKANDGTVLSTSSLITVNVTGENDAPTVIATPTAIDRVESDFGTLAGNINSYHILTEAEIFALMDVQDVDVTDSLNLSLVTDSSNFVVNGTDVTGSTNGVVQLTAADITGYGLDPAVVNVGDFFVYSLEFDGLAKDELASVTFEVKANDGTVLSTSSLITVNVTGENDAPTVIATPTAIDRVESDFGTLAGNINSYHILTEAEIFALMDVQDVDVTDSLNLSLVTDSSNFVVNGTDVTGSTNGVVQLTAADITGYGLDPAVVNVGDFFVYSLEFDGLAKDELASVTFEVKANDGTVLSTSSLITVNVTGENDAPTVIATPTAIDRVESDFGTLAGNINSYHILTEAEIFALMDVQDVDVTDSLNLSLVTDSSNFVVNGTDVTGSTNGVVQLTAADITGYGLDPAVVNVGDFFVYSLEFDGLAKDELASVTFEVKANDGTVLSTSSLITVNVTGENDAPTVIATPTAIDRVESDFGTLAGNINSYHILTEAEIFALMDVQDVDVTDSLNLSLVTDSSNFVVNGTDVTGSTNGVVQLTAADITGYGLDPAVVNVGDFFVYSLEFDGLAKDELASVTFEVKANDGTVLSTSSLITVNVTGENDAPTVIATPTAIDRVESDFGTLAGNINSYHILTEAEIFALMDVQDVDVTDSLNLSLVTDSSNFVVNGTDVTGSTNGVVQLTAADITGYGLDPAVVNVGDFFVYSLEFDGLAKDELASVTFEVKANDGTVLSTSSLITVNVTGENDAPTVIATPTAIDRVESDFGTLAGNINSYHILTEAEIFALMDVQDVDVTDSLNLSLVTDNSNFVVNGTDVTGSTNGVVQLTAADITGFGLDPAVVNVGDFFVYSLEFDGLAKDELASVTFEVKANDGTVLSTSSLITVNVTGENDAPTVIATPTAIDRVESDFGTLAGNINSYHILTEAEIFALMDVQDVDVTDSLNLSLVTDSSNFVVNGTDVTGSTNGVVQLTAADITGYGLDPAVVNVGDFFVYSLEFDGLAKDELASVTFEVKANDGTVLSTSSLITVNVTGENDAPTVIATPTAIDRVESDFGTLAGNINSYHILTEAEIFALMDVQDVDVTDSLNLSLVTDSSNFVVNGTDVTGSTNGVVQLTAADITGYGLDPAVVNVGDFFVYSLEFDGLAKDELASVTFEVKANDGTVLSTSSLITVNVTGENDAPTVIATPTAIDRVESDFGTLAGNINSYHILTEAEIFALMDVQDVDVTDSLNLSLVTDSSNFVVNGTDVTGSTNGVVQLTAADITGFGLDPAVVNVGDFFVYSLEFDGLAKDELASVTFEVKANDGTVLSTSSLITVNVTGENDAPTVIATPTAIDRVESDFGTLAGNINSYHILTEAEIFALMDVQDVDVTDSLNLSLVTDSSNFVVNGTDVTGSTNGVVQLTAADITGYGLDPAVVNVGDFFVYSLEFDGLAKDELASVTFEVKANDGTVLSTSSLITVNVTGENDAPIISATTEVDGTYVNGSIPLVYDSSIIVADINATDKDVSDTLVYSLVANATDDSQYLTIDSSTGIVKFVDETSYNNANVNALNFQVKVEDQNGGEAFYSIQSGVGIDGYIVNMTVFSDTNNNSVLDLGEATDTTNSTGDFTLSGVDLSGTVIGYGGTDISTNLDFEGIYKAPAGSLVLNPITTLLANLMNEGNTLEESKVILQNDFGIDVSVDLLADPISQAMSASTSTIESNYTTVQMLNIKIDNTIGKIAAAISGASITDERTASDVISQELAKLLDSATTIDLDNGTFIDLLVTNTLNTLGGSLDANIQSDLVDIILNINSSITNTISAGLTPLEVFESLAKVQIAAEEVENQLESAISGETDTSVVVASSTGESFTSKIDAAVVGSITKEQALNNEPEANTSFTIASNENVYYTGKLFAEDTDIDDTLTYSWDSSSVSMKLTISDINNLDLLVALNNPIVIQALSEVKSVALDFLNNGNILGVTTLSSQSILVGKSVVATLLNFFESNGGTIDKVLVLKDFIETNKDALIAQTSLALEDIEVLKSALTMDNFVALKNLYNTLDTFITSNTYLIDAAKVILADNQITPAELATIDPAVLAQVEDLRLQVNGIIASNPDLVALIDIPTIITKAQEIVTIDTVNGEVSLESVIGSTLVESMITLDENTGEYTVVNPYLALLPDSTQVEISFDYAATDSFDETDTSTATILITSDNIPEIDVSLDDEGVLRVAEDQDIDMASLLSNITSNIEVSDIDSIDLSNSEHILSNLTISDFEEMISDTASNTLSIKGENNDVIKLDLSIWSKDNSDTDLNAVEDITDDSFIAYTTTGTHDQVLTLLIDKDIIVQDI